MEKINKMARGIKCNLYSVNNLDSKMTENKIGAGIIIGRNLFISQLAENYKPISKDDYSEYEISYSYSIPFDIWISIKGNKKRKLNTKISYEIRTLNINTNQICYTYLTSRQKFIISLRFNRLWIQNSTNIMWIINILIALLAIMATLSKGCNLIR